MDRVNFRAILGHYACEAMKFNEREKPEITAYEAERRRKRIYDKKTADIDGITTEFLKSTRRCIIKDPNETM